MRTSYSLRSGPALPYYRDLFRANRDMRVFGVDFGALEVEDVVVFPALVNTLATAIEKMDADQLIVYGHYAGAAAGTCIASAIASTISSLSLVLAVSRPIETPDTAIRQAESTSDSAWAQYLRPVGRFTEVIEPTAGTTTYAHTNAKSRKPCCRSQHATDKEGTPNNGSQY